MKRRGVDVAVPVAAVPFGSGKGSRENDLKSQRQLGPLVVLLVLVTTVLVLATRIRISAQGSPRVTLSGVLVVNLDRDVDAWKTTQSQLASSSLLACTPTGIRRLRATDASEIDLDAFLGSQRLTPAAYNDIVEEDRVVTGVQLTLGALGCLESHVAAWRRVVDAGVPMAIFEDDVELVAGGASFDRGLARALSRLPPTFGLLYLANVIGDAITPSLAPFDDVLWLMNGSHWGTYAYVISPRAAATLLAAVYPAYAQVDLFIIDAARRHALPVFMSRTPLVRVDNRGGRVSRTQRWAARPQRIPRLLHVFSSRAGGGGASSAWSELHPAWEVRRWTPDSLALELPGRPHAAAAVELVLRAGGVFVDADALEPLRPIEPLLRGLDAFFALDGAGRVSASIFGMTPQHELVLAALIAGSDDAATGGGALERVFGELSRGSTSSGSLTPLAVRAFAPHIFSPNATLGASTLAYAIRRDAASVAFFFPRLVALRASLRERATSRYSGSARGTVTQSAIATS